MKNKLLILLLTLTFIKGIIWSVITPIFQAPDENIHYIMIHYLGETGQHPGKKSAINSQETLSVIDVINFPWRAKHPVWRGFPPGWRQQIINIPRDSKTQFIYQQGTDGGQKLPPAYYWFNFPLYHLAKNQHFLIRFYLLRLISIILGVVTAYLTYLLSQLFFKKKHFSLAIASLVAFQPMASVIFSSITYDTLAIVISTLFLYLSIKFIITKNTKFQLTALIVGLFGLIVKTQLIGLVLAWPFLLKKSQRRYLILFIPLLIFLTTKKDYSEIINQGITWLSSGQMLAKFTHYFKLNARALWAEVFPWYWGVFGWLEKTMPLWIYRILKILIGMSFIGLIKSIKKLSPPIIFLILFSIIMASVIFINDFIIFTQRGSVFGIQGRYFLPAMSAHIVLLVFGLTQLLPKSSHQLFACLMIAFSLILHLIGFYTLYQFFGWVWV